MKKTLVLFSAIFLILSIQSIDAQIWKKIKDKAADKVTKKAEEKMDEILNKKKKSSQKKDPKETPETEDESPTIENSEPSKSPTTNKAPKLWRNYKFIPGEKVIFLDDLKYEEVGEFPSRWDLLKGGAEVALLDNKKIILGIAEYHNRITPLFNTKNYLSDEFTIEFDIYVDHFSDEYYNAWSDYNIIFDSNNLGHSNYDIDFTINSNGTSGHAITHDYKVEQVPVGAINQWHHIAISYYKGKLKMYYDEKRILNLPRVDLKPDIFAIDYRSVNSRDLKVKCAIKNIRIAHGGGQMYKRIIADGKYVTNGILFDSGKAIIQSQSMGIINKIAAVMKENADWNFQIIGHTDSDGSTENNLALSEQRAEAVKQALISQDIKAERLTVLGKGENEPLNTNSSPEEKANNRRVEFVKN